MILYGSSLSPFVRKVIAFAAEQDVELEVRRVAPGGDDGEFREASPFGKIPALRHRGANPDGSDFCLAESTAIVFYLDALKPDTGLIPSTPRSLARTIWFDEYADTILAQCGSAMFFNRIVAPRFLGLPGDPAVADRAERELLPVQLDYLEKTVPDEGFLVDDRLTLADLSVASPFVNFRHLGIEIDDRPRLKAYIERIHARPGFAQSIELETAFLARTA